MAQKYMGCLSICNSNTKTSKRDSEAHKHSYIFIIVSTTGTFVSLSKTMEKNYHNSQSYKKTQIKLFGYNQIKCV